MSREIQLAKNTIIITISKISTQFINFILLPVYTSLLTTEEFGVVDLLNTYVMLLVPIVTLQLENALFRFLIDTRKNNDEKTEYITTSLISIAIQSLIYFTILGFASSFIHNDYKYFLAINVVSHIFLSILLQISRGLGDNTSYALGSMTTATSTVFLNIIFVMVFRLGAIGMLSAVFISNILGAAFILFKKRIYQYISIKAFRKDKLKILLNYSIPLIPNALSWWIINASDRTIITTFIGLGANGIYAAANKFSGVYIMLYNIFNLTWTESASLYINDEDRDIFFNNTINVMFKLFSSICFGIIAFMPFLFSLLINKSFNQSFYHIPILMLGSLFNVVIGLYSAIYIATKQTKKVANTSIVAGIINITCNLVLINKIGLYAASISTAVSFFVLMIFRYVDVQKYVDIKFSNKLIISSVLMIVLLFVTYYRQKLIGHLIALIITIVYTIIINRKIIIQVIKFFKNKISRH